MELFHYKTSGEANTGKYYIKWADENGDYLNMKRLLYLKCLELMQFKHYNFIKLNLIPIEASRIVAIKDNVIKQVLIFLLINVLQIVKNYLLV